MSRGCRMIWKLVLSISLVVVISLDSTNGIVDSLPCDFLDSINITNGRLPTDNTKSITFNGTTFGPNEYAVVGYELDHQMEKVSVEPHLRGCYCKSKPCVRICCPPGREYKFKHDTCEHIADVNKSQTIEMTILNENGENETISAIDKFNIIYDQPHCKGRLIKHNYSINYTGDAIVGITPLYHVHYCVLYSPRMKQEELLICESDTDEFAIVLGWCMLISVPFMITTILVYRFVEALRNLHGKCFIAYLITLTFAFFTTALIKLSTHGSITCHINAWIMYFSYFSAFLWLNVISFDLWSNTRRTNGNQRFPDGRLFVNYFIYAVGIAFTFTVFAITLNYSKILPALPRPGVHYDMCFIRGKFENGLYFYGPLAIILSINVVLFISTAMQIRQLQNGYGVSSSEQATRTYANAFRINYEKCILYSKLFVVMGISWIMEVVSFFSETFNNSEIGKFFELFNALQGVVIFSLLVLAPHTLKFLKKRFRLQRAQPGSISDTKESNQWPLTQVDGISHIK